MLRSELEALTMRNGEELPQMAFESAERYYMSDNDFHKYNNPHGTAETKAARADTGGTNYLIRVHGRQTQSKVQQSI